MDRRIFAALTHEGLVRGTNEDSFCWSQPPGLPNSFAVICDGIGGNGNGDVASTNACRLLHRAFLTTELGTERDPERFQKILRDQLEQINTLLYERNQLLGRRSSMGCTLVMIAFLPDRWVCAHGGDSRLYEFTPDGGFLRHTADDSLEACLADRFPGERVVDAPGNVITKALGIRMVFDPVITVHERHAGSTFLLCTDGLTHAVPDAELLGILQQNQSLHQAAHALVRAALVKGDDNVTVILTGEKESSC